VIAVYIAARIHALHAFSSRVTDISLAQNLLTIPSLLVFYARLLLWPVGLSAFYDTRYTSTISDALVPLLFCAIAGAAAVYVLVRARSRTAWFATILLLVPLAPLMKLDVFFRGEIAHDRYLYLPSVGFALLLGLIFREIHAVESRRKTVAYGAVAIAIFFFSATMGQTLYWANDLVLYARGVAIAPDNLIVRNDLANELMKRGYRDTAVAQYRDVLRRDPSFWLARYNLGYAEYTAGDCAAASHDLDLAARQNALDAETFFYLGDCRFRLGDRQQGIALMRHGIELDPRLPNLRATLADDLAATGDAQNLHEALDLYRAEASANPAHPTAGARAAELSSKLGNGR
jgi:tetratricopeptide (TPR) repeat protein